MESTRRRTRRSWAALAAAAGLTAGLLAFATPAQAASGSVDDATFTWGVSGYAQAGIFGPWNFKDFTGDAAYLQGSVSGGTQTEYVVGAVPATSMPASTPQKTPNAVKFSNGTGTIDPDTGAGQLSWDGSYTINAYPAQYGAPNEIFNDPILTVAADGSGTLTSEFTIGAGTDMSGNPFDAQGFGRLTVATFDAGSLSNQSATGYRVTPDYQGVTAALPSGTSPQTTTCSTSGGATGWWGAWPSSFTSALGSHASGASVLAHYYSTGCGGMQDRKPPLPIDVSFTADTSGPVDPGPAADEQDLQVTVPETPVDPEPGEFVWAIDGTNGLVDLGTAVKNGDHYVAGGAINPVRVTDTRATAPAWSVAAQVSDFTSGTTTLDGKYLGWTPSVTENTGGATAGTPVASGFTTGTGLKAASTLGSATTGHALGSALLGAVLDLKLPLTAQAGTYQSTLTLTALS